MDITTAIPVVTGANRGLGRALVDALLERGAPKVYALARDPQAVRQDPRVVAVALRPPRRRRHRRRRRARRRCHRC